MEINFLCQCKLTSLSIDQSKRYILAGTFCCMVNMQHHYQHDRNWSQLPPELLQLICKNLLDILDFVHFRAVCKDWRTATLASDYCQQPWLSSCNALDGVSFNILTSTQWTVIKVPAICKEKIFLSFSQGYMLTRDANRSAYYLLNPITGKEIQLPPLDDWFYKLLDVKLDKGVPKYVAVCESRTRSIRSSILRICRIGDEKWTTVYREYTSRSRMMCTFYKSSVFVKSAFDGEVIDAKPSVAVHRITPPTNKKPFVLCRPCGNASSLLAITTNRHLDRECMLFEIYLLDDENGNPRWIKTNNIGDQVVFWSGWSCICWKTHNSSVYKRNSVYFRSLKGFGRFDIENSSVEKFQHPSHIGRLWFLPSLV